MRRASKKFLVLVMSAILMMAMLAGCGKDPAIVGTWEAATVEASGITLDFKEFAKQIGDESMSMKLTAKSDKTFTMDMGGESGEGTWEEKDGKFILTADGDDMEVQIEDGKLIFAEESLGAKITFEKK